MSRIYKILSVFALVAILTLSFATPAYAFEDRTGEKIVIKADEVIDDDLYVAANEFVLDGTIKGDLIVVGSKITINGTVEGDVLGAAQAIVINGTVKDDVRIAGAILQVGDKASIGGDLVAAGAGLETQKGSKVDGELVVAGGQALLAGDVAKDVLAGAGSLELAGNFGGNVEANVGDVEANSGGPSPSMFMPQTGVAMPVVPPGLTIPDSAKIAGNLKYTSTREIQIPSGPVAGKVTFNKAIVETVATPTPAQSAIKWTLDLLRSMVTLILLGLLIGWLAPTFLKSLMDKVQNTPWPSLGWGVVGYAVFFVALLAVVIVMIIGGVVFGALTLGSLSGTIVWIGILALFALILAFVLFTAFVAKITIGWLGGKMILARIKPELAEHKIWPLVVGMIIIAILIALPLVGWLFNLVIVLFGLGALWLWTREKMVKPIAAA